MEPSRTAGGSRRYSDADIDLLRRIQDLTNAGLNLAGVERVLQLEQRVRDLEAELDRTRAAAREAVADAERRNRYDLVPVRQSVVLFEGKRRRR